jgi:dTDP-4-dehydrorhamnose 3,5-epimerase-like enzyme
MNTEELESISGCRLLKAGKAMDDRGTLCFAEGNEAIPFDIKRNFWIYGVGQGKTRGGHSHSTCSEAIFPVKGSFEIMVTDGERCATICMNDPSRGILIPAGVWCELKNFSPDAICFVAASQHYDATGYTNDFNKYKKICK